MSAGQHRLVRRALLRRQQLRAVPKVEGVVERLGRGLDLGRGVFEGNESKFVYAHWDGTAETEAKVKEDTKATIRCIPLEGEKEEGVCMVTGKPSAQRVLFAKSY